MTAARLVVRVAVALAAAELLGARVVGVLEVGAAARRRRARGRGRAAREIARVEAFDFGASAR